jgi:2C-methyl-D-erythritol 2,4-cyclodiphosphate synthase
MLAKICLILRIHCGFNTMLHKTLQKYKSRLKDLQKETKKLDAQIVGEENLYLESKQKLEENIASQVKVDSLQVNMLTYTPDLSQIKDEDIAQLIKQY